MALPTNHLWRGLRDYFCTKIGRGGRKIPKIMKKVPPRSEHKAQTPSTVGMKPRGIFMGWEVGVMGWGLRRQNTKYRI